VARRVAGTTTTETVIICLTRILIDIQEFAPAEVAELDLYQKREKIYTRKIEGFYQRLRVFTGWPLLLGYYCIPWISINGRRRCGSICRSANSTFSG
jgi:hypothetical protein